MNGHRFLRVASVGMSTLALLACGCGKSSGPAAVKVSLLAPTSNATVTVKRLFVTGSVQPSSAKVRIAGRRAPTRHGKFGLWLALRRGLTHIRVDARAPGYVADATDVSVRSVPPPPVAKPAAVQQSFGDVERVSADSWTPAARAVSRRACLASGGWQSYCACALRYEVAAGPPRQLARGMLAARARRRLPHWLKQTIVHCL
jgi:hypothetical protein